MSAEVNENVMVGVVVVNMEEFFGNDRRIHFLRSAYAFGELRNVQG